MYGSAQPIPGSWMLAGLAATFTTPSTRRELGNWKLWDYKINTYLLKNILSFHNLSEWLWGPFWNKWIDRRYICYNSKFQYLPNIHEKHFLRKVLKIKITPIYDLISSYQKESVLELGGRASIQIQKFSSKIYQYVEFYSQRNTQGNQPHKNRSKTLGPPCSF